MSLKYPHYNGTTQPQRDLARVLGNRAPALSRASLVRPANTTAYADGDVVYPAAPGVGDQIKALTFENAVSTEGGSGLIVSATLVDYAAEATRLVADLYLFSAPLVTAPTDNAVFAPVAADMANFLDVIQFSSGGVRTAGTHSIYRVVPNVVVDAAASTRSLYGILVARNAYAPLSAERIDISLGIMPRDLALF